jgi:hypothetical protein
LRCRWADPDNIERFRVRASCSWCFKEGPHDLQSFNSTKRDTYKCENCHMLTAKCRSTDCPGMVRNSSWIDSDSKCAACVSKEYGSPAEAGGQGGWPALRAKAAAQFDAYLPLKRVIFQLERRSEEIQKAYKAGCARLFLLLVSMQPHTRNRVACLMGWTTVTQPFFGDSHAEAWDIISRFNQGIIACTAKSYESLNPGSRDFNYYDVLYRVGLQGMPDCKDEMMRRFQVRPTDWSYFLCACVCVNELVGTPSLCMRGVVSQVDSEEAEKWCKRAELPNLRMLEDTLIAKMAQMHRARMTDVQRKIVENMEKDEHYLKTAANMENCVADPRVKQYAADMAMMVYYSNAVVAGNTLVTGAVAGMLSSTGTGVGTSLGGLLGSVSSITPQA